MQQGQDVLTRIPNTVRAIDQIPFEESKLKTIQLPTDTTIKSLVVRLAGDVTTTYASGTPVADAESIMDNLIESFIVQVDGGRVVKAVRPHFLRLNQLWTTGILAERRASAAASAAVQPTTDQGFVYGTTGQVTTFAETLSIDFEMIYCDSGLGRELTWLNLRGRTTAVLKVQFKPFSSLLGFGNTAPVVYSANNVTLDVASNEAHGVPAGFEFFDFRETHGDYSFSGATTGRGIELRIAQYLAGIKMFAKEGQAGSTTTASGKLASDILVTNISVKKNGKEELFSSTWKKQQMKNRLDAGTTAPTASSVSLLTGACHINFLARKNLDTKLDCRRPAVDSLYLYLSTSASATYTNPAIVTVGVDEIVNP